MENVKDLHERLSAMCERLAESEEAAWGTHTQWSAGGKVFARFMVDHHGDGRIALWCKCAPGVQEALLDSGAERFFRPPYVGNRGWIGVRLDLVTDWEEIEDLVEESYRLLASKRLVRGLAATK
jgi:predicted DNA-binding protein (MmcQ/YjbR family)